MARKITTEIFISDARKVWASRYGYSKVNYKRHDEKVIITCEKHGDFRQTPNSHLQKHGCPDCGGRKRWSTEKFVERGTAIHKGKYDYSRTVYRDMYSEVIIGCNIHGWFEKKPVKHIHSKQGCQKCARESMKRKLSKTTEEFILEVRNVHGYAYDYSRVAYTNKEEYIEIRCIKHDWWFPQRAGNHLRGDGCRKCAKQYSPNSEEWIQRAVEIHGERYDYSDVDYVNNSTSVTISCSIHGPFPQVPEIHIRGSGCSGCAEHGFNTSKPAYYYVNVIKNKYGDILEYKGGITNSDPQRRYYNQTASFRFSYPELSYEQLESIHFESGLQAKDLEFTLKGIEEIRSPFRNFDGGHELFIVNPLTYARENNLVQPSG